MKKIIKKPKIERLEIVGLIDSPKWKKLYPCVCNGLKDFKHCRYCRYQNCEDSIPREPFQINLHGGKKALIKKITITRGSDDDVLGWEGEV